MPLRLIASMTGWKHNDCPLAAKCPGIPDRPNERTATHEKARKEILDGEQSDGGDRGVMEEMFIDVQRCSDTSTVQLLQDKNSNHQTNNVGGGGDSRPNLANLASKEADDDGLQTEELRLGAAEASLQAELDIAAQVGEFLLSPSETNPVGLLDDIDDGSRDTSASKEAHFMVSAIFCLLGIGLLLPWNAFISAEPYFHSRLCSSSSDPSQGSDDGIELYFGLVFNSCGFLSLVFVLFLGHRPSKLMRLGTGRSIPFGSTSASSGEEEGVAEQGLPTTGGAHDTDNGESLRLSAVVHERPHPTPYGRKQVLWSLSLYLVMFLLTTIIVLIENIHRHIFLAVTLVCLAVFGICLALAGTGIVGVAGIFPPRVAIAPFFAGQAVGGVVISGSNFVVAAALESPQKFWNEHCLHNNLTSTVFDNNETDDADCPPYRHDLATFWYFSLGCIVLCACIIGFTTLDRLEITCNYRQEAQQRLLADEDQEKMAENYDDIGLEATSEDERLGGSSLMQPLISKKLVELPSSMDDEEEEEVTLASVLRAIKMPALAIHVTAFVTLSVFPAWTSMIESAGLCIHRGRLQNDLFEPLSFLMFNLPDLMARVLASIVIDVNKIRTSPGTLAVAALCRFVFLPMFLFCKSSSTAIHSIDSDYYSISLAFAFSFTNGALMSLAFMSAPQLLSPAEDVQQLGSAIMNFSLASGLLLGSLFSFVYIMFATGHWG